MPKQNQITSSLSEVIPTIADTTNWLPLILEIDQTTIKSKISRKCVPELVKGASKAIKKFERQVAVNQITLGLYLYPTRMFDEIRRTGLFRSSKYKFNARCLRRVLTEVLGEQTSLNLSQEFVDYGRSILNLTEISQKICRLNESIIRFITRRKSYFLKTTVALIDAIFMTERRAIRSLSTDQWEHYSIEELAEAASYLIYCFDDRIGIQDHHFNHLDEEALIRGFYHSVLVKGCKIRSFLEAEILLDAFNYQCQRQNQSCRILAPYSQMEKSIRLGFIQQEQAYVRDIVDRNKAISDGEQSIFTYADSIYDHFHQSIVKTLESPFKRYVFLLPELPEFKTFFSDDGLFIEEKFFLIDILVSEMSTWEELRSFEISDGILVLDMLKVIRLFAFIRHLAKRHLEPRLKDEPLLVYRSLIPVFNKHKIHSVLEWCLPPDKIEKILNLMSWTPGTSGLFDLQYKPIIRGSHHFLLPMNLFSTANWYRNLAHTEKKRIMQTIDEDTASRHLAEIIGGVSRYTRKTFRTTLEGKQVEIDVVARFGEILFIFECKHPLLPCNIHELRTTYDHMKKGAITLTRIVEILNKQKFENELYRRLGWDLEPAKEIVTCLVSCNGMFPGLSIDGHPIRRWAELKNMINSGVIRVSSFEGNTDMHGSEVDEDLYFELNLWDKPVLTPEFLQRYICEDLLHAPLFRAMIEWERSYYVGNAKLSFSTFFLDTDAMRKHLMNYLPSDEGVAS